MAEVAERLGSALAGAVSGVVSRPRSVLGAALLVTLLAGVAAALHLRVNADQDAMFSDDLPHRVAEIAYLREFPVLYVYLPRSAFLEQHALLYLSTPELEDFADRLARMQPYLAGLAEDGTLRGLAMLLARGARAAYEGDVESAELAPIFRRVRRALQASLDDVPYRFSWAELVAGRVLGEPDAAAGRRLLIAQPVPRRWSNSQQS